MKYMVLMMPLVVIAGMLVGSELYFESPATRAHQRTIAQRTVEVMQTQAGTSIALEATMQAIEPAQTQMAVARQQQDILRATQVAYENGVYDVATATLVPRQSPTQVAQSAPAVSSSNSAYNITTASGINDVGCAANNQRQFDLAALPSVYMVAVATDVQPGTTFSTRWYPTTDEMNSYRSTTWEADAYYEETCVYFWIDNTDIAYTQGAWSVELLVNDTVAQTTQFSFCDTEMGC